MVVGLLLEAEPHTLEYSKTPRLKVPHWELMFPFCIA